MIKALIADDEKHARDRLKDILLSTHQFDIIAEADDGNKAFELIVLNKPDVAFLDINMPGLSVFQSIPSLSSPPLIVFQTAYSEHASKAFEIDALDYIMKPVRKERINQTIQKIKNALKLKNDVSDKTGDEEQVKIEKITVKVRESIKIIPVKNIYRISSEEGLSFLYTSEGRFMADKYLNYYENMLKNSGFFRTDRAHLVNLDYISVIHSMFKGSYMIELKDKSRVELSRRKASILKKIMAF